ncbi:hypothetical protein DAPPUDRAFT_248859 [Daphnia pulex]|uniref:Uncharacterized protein n=1 Tax=Daphnia pulex TaxID=6669 RepID=E9GVC4_DAPPU|nr:hypothetical protein DAPPUDRAFT_248859 [Daphnia pulex]|eukprot:EFX76558.1 hypothetical protein DAPPUDRAFT_248859 [Daphnia pulex]
MLLLRKYTAQEFCSASGKSLLSITNKREQNDVSTVLMPIVLNESASKASINIIPQSCKDLLDIGHRKSGIYSVMGNKHVETVYCNFTKYPNTPDFQKWIVYEDMKSVSTCFYVQRNASFNKKNTC